MNETQRCLYDYYVVYILEIINLIQRVIEQIKINFQIIFSASPAPPSLPSPPASEPAPDPALLLLPLVSWSQSAPSPALLSASATLLSRKWIFRSRWQNGITLSLYCFILKKITTPSSLSLTSVMLPKFRFLRIYLLFWSCTIHFKLKSKQWDFLHAYSFSKPVNTKADSYDK